MSSPNTPAAGSASGSHGLPAGAWSTRHHTTPNMPPPPRPRASTTSSQGPVVADPGSHPTTTRTDGTRLQGATRTDQAAAGENQKHWSGTSASGQGQARRSRVTRHALRAPPACTPPPPAPCAPHTQARRHPPPVCATTGYGGGQQSGRPWDRTTATRLAQSPQHKREF